MANVKKAQKASTKEKLKERKKERKLKLKEKRARLVVKNLPFKTTGENLKEFFEQFGEVSEVKLLKNEKDKVIGCGFVQFNQVQKAAKARFHTNGKDFLGRKIKVDFAQPKDQYAKNKNKTTNNCKQSVSVNKQIDEEGSESDIEATQEESIKSDEDEEEEEEKVNKLSDDDDDSDNDDEEEDDDDDDESMDKSDIKLSKPKVYSHDVKEGKTVFIRNVPFSATNEDLRECLSQFGPVYYALICIDKYTEHSKGTAFAKFVNKEDAEKALNAGTELKLEENILDCQIALEKGEIAKASDKKDKKQDSRNLYLVKEGVILAGSKAAEGVSAADMSKRLQLEQYKTQMLRNLNMFVSRERLVIHNLPPHWDDKKLRSLIENNVGKHAQIKEARIMRDMKKIEANGLGKSKEFGFVTFSRHEDALNCLRSLNNNPDVFGVNRRPIITFSIENKVKVKARLKRLQNSQLQNPLSKCYDPTLKKKEEKSELSEESENARKFSGVAAKPGSIQKMRSKFKLRNQAKLHYENVKKEKRKKKMEKKTLSERKASFIKQPKQKINNKVERDDFSKIVNNYKSQITKNTSVKNMKRKSKWYESTSK